MVGVDSIKIGQEGSHQDRVEWTTNFMDEMHNEAHEAKENFLHKWWIKEVKDEPKRRFEIVDIAKVKLEVIDMLHFLVSACHVYFFGNFDTYLFEYTAEVLKNSEEKEHGRNVYFQLARLAMSTDPGTATAEMMNLLRTLKMSDEEVLNIYKMKWDKNKLRQKNNYAHATKTETDNNELEANIK
jgi:dimeric dUTPase (all-alpha-NTP-PPase superfamily)